MPKPILQHLIRVSITFPIHGIPSYAYATGFPPQLSPPDHLKVSPGNMVGWFVEVSDQNQRLSYPPYEITFSNPATFGMTSLSVPGGRSSPFIHAISTVKVPCKYTLTVEGVGAPDDPEIIIDNVEGSIIFSAAKARVVATPAAYQILWDTSNNSTSLQWRKLDAAGNGKWYRFVDKSMPVLNANDLVTYLVSPAADPFTVVFDNQPNVTLFDLETDIYTVASIADGTGAKYSWTGKLTVIERDGTPDMTFNFNIVDTKHKVPSDSATLSSTQPPVT
jgi:hypothetical protein